MTLREGFSEEENLERKNLFAKQKIFLTISLYFCLLFAHDKSENFASKKLEKLREKIMQKFHEKNGNCGEKKQKFHEKCRIFKTNAKFKHLLK